MTTDALAPGVIEASASTPLTIQSERNEKKFFFQEDRFQQTVSSQSTEIVENTNNTMSPSVLARLF